MPHEVKVRDREMTARRRSKMAVLTPSMLKAAAVPGGGGRGRGREWKPSVMFFWNFPLLGPGSRGSGEKEMQSEIRGLGGRGGRKGKGCSRVQTDCQNVNM